MASITIDLDAWVNEDLELNASIWVGDQCLEIETPIKFKQALESMMDSHRVGLAGDFSKQGKKDLLAVVKKLNATAKWFEKKVRDEC